MIVTLTAYRRPGYLRDCLAALAEAVGELDEDVHVYVDVDHHPDRQITARVVEVIKEADERIESLTLTIHAHPQGCQGNTYANLEAGWHAAEKFDEDFVVHLEDDAVIARDGLRFLAWAREEYRDDPDIFSVTTYRMDEKESSYKRSDEVARHMWFTCLGPWGTWRDRWVQMRRDWPHDTKDWAWRMVWAERGGEKGTGIIDGRQEVYPILSRAQNIGAKDSTFVRSPTWHAKHHETKVWAGLREMDDVLEWREADRAPRA